MHLSLPLLDINLPIPIFIHALSLLAVSQYLIFSGISSPSHSPNHGAPPASANSAVVGVTTLAISLGYLTCSYMPISENQYLYASVPVRLLLAGIAGLRAFLGGKGAEWDRQRRTLLGIMIYDGLGAVWAGYLLGRWDGRVPSGGTVF